MSTPGAAAAAAEKQRLVEENLGLARRLSQRFATSHDSAEDLFQVASLALVLASERFDPDRGHSFTSFAIPTILGELRRHIRDTHWTLRVPRRVQENLAAIRSSREGLEQELGRTPTPRDMAEHTGLSVEDVLETLEAGAFLRGSPGDADAQDAAAQRDETALLERIATKTAVAQLEPREQLVLTLRYREDLTQSEIGRRIGLSQAHVHRLLRAAEKRLRALTGDEAAGEDDRS